MPNRADLERLPRDELVSRARELGVARPEVMTRVELADEIVRLTETDPVARNKARGWFGIARDLVASLIDKGLNMPDAAELVRTTTNRVVQRAPVATVTLAEIYAAQGHVRRALNMLGEVLTREPDHDVARRLRERLSKDAPAEPVVVGDEPESDPEPEPVSAEPAPESESVSVSAPEPEPVSVSAPEPEPVSVSAPEPVSVSAPEPEPVSVSAPEPEPVSVTAPVRESASVFEPEPAPESASVSAPEPVSVSAPEPAPESLASSGPEPALLLQRTAEGWFAYWEVPPSLVKRAVVKVVAWVPRVIGAARIEREVRVTLSSGGTMLPSFGARAVVRGALGVSSASGFSPCAVASVIDRGDDSGSWAPPTTSRASLDVERRARAALDARPS